jgi:hypothetical protein
MRTGKGLCEISHSGSSHTVGDFLGVKNGSPAGRSHYPVNAALLEFDKIQSLLRFLMATEGNGPGLPRIEAKCG